MVCDEGPEMTVTRLLFFCCSIISWKSFPANPSRLQPARLETSPCDLFPSPVVQVTQKGKSTVGCVGEGLCRSVYDLLDSGAIPATLATLLVLGGKHTANRSGSVCGLPNALPYLEVR